MSRIPENGRFALKQGNITCTVGSVFSHRVRVCEIFVAKQLHHLVKELEFLSLPSGNNKEKQALVCPERRDKANTDKSA